MDLDTLIKYLVILVTIVGAVAIGMLINVLI